MHDHVYFDGRVLSAEQAQYSAVSAAALYAKGIFTTIAIFDGEPFLWEKHWRRLSKNAAELNIDLSAFSEESTRKALEEIIVENGAPNGRARITFFDESSSSIWQFEEKRKTSLLIMTADRRQIPVEFKVTISAKSVPSNSFLAGIKSCNYLDSILAFDNAKERGFDEAIRLNERGEVTSGCMANVFWIEDGRLFTPSLRTGCLPGTTREFILEKLECEEVERSESAIHEADAIFLTSAGLGVVGAKELEGKRLSEVDHPILNLIHEITA